ncbi:MAG TPA: protein kinase [Gemmataceae bacterium]|nr:protein kinase [Gemmataceae bacterium]
MLTDDRLLGLLERWVAESDAGRSLSVAELCRDCPELLPEAERQVAVLRQFHALSQPPATTSVEVRDQAETSTNPASGAPPVGTLPVPGARFGRYRIVAELGHGGMGIVYSARDTQLDREVALKVVRPDRPGTTDRFLREARAMAAVRHDHVVEIYDYGEQNGVRFVAMPLLAGETLATRRQRQSPLPVAEVIRIGTELAEGLAAVHEKRLIHRDLKPSNVWLETPRGRVKLLDFGLARDPGADDGVTSPGTLVGTLPYMSPEQVNGLALDARSDLFSLGSVLYEAATGQAAFAAPTQTALLHAVGEKQPPPARIVNPAVPAALSDLIERLHQKRPADRPASAAEVAKELGRLAADPETPTTEWQAVRPDGMRRHKWFSRGHIAVAGALGMVLILAAIVYHSVTNRPRETGVVEPPPTEPTRPSELIRVRSLDVLHNEGIDANQTRLLGPFGKETFAASPQDDIKVTARLSRPAYCYLIVFRPDGVDEVLYPQGADLTPGRTDEPHYPSKDRSKVYGLTDGTGLWLVALVASDQPLPSFADWRRQHAGGPWGETLLALGASSVGLLGSPHGQGPYLAASALFPGRIAGEANVIWLDDGNWLEALTPHGARNRGTRGEKTATGLSPVVKVVDWLKTETGGVVSAVGFTVEGKR